MSGAKHTPGPWWTNGPRADESFDVCAGGIGLHIARVHQGAIANASANAALIAASPALYDYVAKQAAAGDQDAIALVEAVHASR